MASEPLLTERPWRSRQNIVGDAPFGFLGQGEGHLLYFLAREYCDGSGVIVDAGSFVGRSAYFFGRGVQARPDRQSIPINCFDNFLVNDGYTAQSLQQHAGATLAIGDSTRGIFDRAVAPVSSLLRVHHGDLLTTEWAPQPIDVLFVDVAKTPQLGSRVAELFFPHLVAGRTVLIQQDYHHPWLPHIHVTMEFLADYFEIVEPRIDESAAFLLRRVIPEPLLRRVISFEFSPEERSSLMAAALQRLAPEDRHYVALAAAVDFGLRGDLDGMRSTFDAARSQYASAERQSSWTSYRDQVWNYLEEREGWRAFDRRDFRTARVRAEACLARGAGYASVHMLRARSCGETGNVREATASFATAYQLDPSLRDEQ